MDSKPKAVVADVEYSDPANNTGERFPFRRDPKSGETSYIVARPLSDAEEQGISVAINGLLNRIKWKKGEAEQTVNVLKFRLQQRARALRALLDVVNVGVKMGDDALAKAYAPFFPGDDVKSGDVLTLDGKLKNMATASIYEGVTEEGTPIRVTREVSLAEFWLSTRGDVCDEIMTKVSERAEGDRATEEGKD
jgi:hypothetical protein